MQTEVCAMVKKYNVEFRANALKLVNANLIL
jgi:hypothetical protein